MTFVLTGSTWKKWDLHVHTPESFYHNYPGPKDEAWETFLTDLENLPEEFKVIGINDYVLVDGYERVLKAKRDENRLKNIDLILPVVELRLDKFGGVVQGGKGGKGASSWSRINIHVIFDQVDPEFIRQQFISAISPRVCRILCKRDFCLRLREPSLELDRKAVQGGLPVADRHRPFLADVT